MITDKFRRMDRSINMFLHDTQVCESENFSHSISALIPHGMVGKEPDITLCVHTVALNHRRITKLRTFNLTAGTLALPTTRQRPLLWNAKESSPGSGGEALYFHHAGL